jgi:hypothetical protein
MSDNREEPRKSRDGGVPPDPGKRLHAIAAWADQNAPRFARRPLEEAFEEMVAEAGTEFYRDAGEWQIEADAVHQVVLRALRNAGAS